MELVALFLAMFRKPLLLLIVATLIIAFARDNPVTAALIVSVPIVAIIAFVALDSCRARRR